MTVSSEISKDVYSGTGAQVDFAVSFYFLANADVKVIHRAADGTETDWLEGTHYSLSGAGKQAGGLVKVTTSPINYTPAVGEKLIIKRDLKIVQETDYPEGGAFPASAHENALDRAAMVAQQTNERLDRALVAPEADIASSLVLPNETSRASKYLAFDSEGSPIASSGPTGASEIPVSAFIETLLDDSDSATALGTLGAAPAGGSGDPYDIPFNAGFASDFAGDDLAVQTYGEILVPRAITLNGENGYLVTPATGSPAVFDVELDGVTVYSTNPQFADSENELTAGELSTTVIPAGSRLTFKCIQKGSSTAGQKAYFTLKATLD